MTAAYEMDEADLLGFRQLAGQSKRSPGYSSRVSPIVTMIIPFITRIIPIMIRVIPIMTWDNTIVFPLVTRPIPIVVPMANNEISPLPKIAHLLVPTTLGVSGTSLSRHRSIGRGAFRNQTDSSVVR